MLLAEELALVALKPESGRYQLGTGDALNACLAGLLIAELLLEGSVGPSDRDDRVVAVPGREVPGSPALAAADDGPIDARTALVLSMTGPAHLLEVVAPERSTRKHARNRIDHALAGTVLEPVGKIVRRLIQEAAAAVGGATASSS